MPITLELRQHCSIYKKKYQQSLKKMGKVLIMSSNEHTKLKKQREAPLPSVLGLQRLPRTETRELGWRDMDLSQRPTIP